jgi:hypothetical protein
MNLKYENPAGNNKENKKHDKGVKGSEVNDEDMTIIQRGKLIFFRMDALPSSSTMLLSVTSAKKFQRMIPSRR